MLREDASDCCCVESSRWCASLRFSFRSDLEESCLCGPDMVNIMVKNDKLWFITL